jgi:mercuric ion transport protein
MFTEKLGATGTLFSAMGCASCFPLLGSIGAGLGLGFLAQFEGLFINTLLPVFAIIALVAALVTWWSHQQHLRGILTCIGPLMVLATLYLFWVDSWSTYLFYAGLMLMFAVAIWDLISPAVKRCRV